MANVTKYSLKGSLPGERFDDFVQAFIGEMFARVIDRTPVLTGRLVNNWNFSTGTANLSASDATGSKESKHDELDGFAKSSVKAGDIVFMSNGLPYAYLIETGSSHQSPSGMVQISALEADDVAAAAKLKAGL